MTNPTPRFDTSSLTAAFEDAMLKLQGYDITSEDYAKALANASKLNRLRMDVSEDAREWDVKLQNLENERAAQAQRTEIEKASQAQAQESARASKRVSADTLAVVGANILGIILILQYEKTDIIGSKAVSFVKSLR